VAGQPVGQFLYISDKFSFFLFLLSPILAKKQKKVVQYNVRFSSGAQFNENDRKNG